MLAFSYFKMKIQGSGRRMAKRAFIASALVDIWAYIMFVLVIIIFSLVYKWTAEGHLEELESVRDVSYGNYMAHIYLRSPVDVGGTEMTMAELLALFDYNRTLALEQGLSCEYRPFDEYQYYCMDGVMGETIVDITNSFMDENLEDTEHIFIINGTGFTYMNAGVFGLGDPRAVISALLSVDIPKENYVTYIPSVDPSGDPVEVYFFYDFPRFIKSIDSSKRGVFRNIWSG